MLKDAERAILKEVVFHYIKNPEPIGSMQLKEAASSELSSATIRNYFRRLVEEGFLTQLHASSGRIPTYKALEEYWTQVFAPLDQVSIERSQIAKSSRLFGVYSSLQKREPNRLLSVASSSNGYLVAEFDSGAVVVPHTALVERLLDQFIGYDISDLIKVAENSQVTSLLDVLWELRSRSISRFNTEALIDFASEYGSDEGYFDAMYGGKMISSLESGIYFTTHAPEGYSLLAQKVQVDGDSGMLMAFGPIERDYFGFVNFIKKEEQ